MKKFENQGWMYLLMGILSVFLFLTHDLEIAYSKVWLIGFFLISTGILLFVLKSFPPAIMIGAVSANILHISQGLIGNVSLAEQGFYTLAIGTIMAMILAMIDRGEREKGDLRYLANPLGIFSYSAVTLLTVQYF